MYHNSAFFPHSVFMCFVWISEQIAIISLYSINWLFLLQRFNPLQPSGHYMYHQFNIQVLLSAHTVYLCILCGSQNKQPLFPYTALNDWFL